MVHNLDDSSDKNQQNCDLLKWWNNNNAKFPILSQLDRDVEATPIFYLSTESAYSSCEQQLDSF